MIYIVHGDDVVASRKKINELVNVESAVQTFSGDSVTISELELVIGTFELFGSSKTILIEKSNKLKKDLVEYIKNIDFEKVTIILYDDSVLKPSIVKQFSKANFFQYDLPKHYFMLLDNIYPHNAHNVFDLLNKTKKVYDIELLFYSIIKRIRLLLLIKQDNYMEFDECKKIKPWQFSKLKKQSDSWNIEQLVNFYHNLVILEKKMKSGELMLSLDHHIDILVSLTLN